MIACLCPSQAFSEQSLAARLGKRSGRLARRTQQSNMDDWEKADEMSDECSSEGEAKSMHKSVRAADRISEAITSPPSSKKSKDKDTTSAKGKSSSSASSCCFVCSQRKTPNSRFCRRHLRLHDAMKYQAEKSGEVQTFGIVMDNRDKCEQALSEFEESNPPGRFRKQIVDWTQFKRTHGVEVAITDRQEEELMDKRDYKMYMKSRGYTSDEGSEDFKAKVREGRDGEGEGGSRKLWVMKNAKRIRDRKRFVTSVVEEGSKAMRSVKFKDAKVLKEFCHDSQASFANTFLKDVGKQGRRVHRPSGICPGSCL